MYAIKIVETNVCHDFGLGENPEANRTRKQ